MQACFISLLRMPAPKFSLFTNERILNPHAKNYRNLIVQMAQFILMTSKVSLKKNAFLLRQCVFI